MLQIPNALQVKQKVEMLEVFLNLETGNKYQISQLDGSKFLFAFEKSNFLWKFLMSARRPLTLKFIDESKEEHFELERGFFFLFSSYKLSYRGQYLGSIKRRFKFFGTKYDILDASDNKVGELKGPFWRPWTFEAFDAAGTKIGLIGKKFSGAKELFTDSDNFSFEVDESIKDNNFKALILAATFAVDYDNFDTSK